MSDTLWANLSPVVDTWFPGETLYSLASRHHHVSGNMLASQTCEQLFGHTHLGCSHDLPAQLDEFVRRTDGALGTPEDIARCHTILPYYFPFRPPRDATNALAAVSRGGLGSLKARLGLLATRFGAAHPLKACHSCMIEDQERFQVAYWHLEHQYPGVWLCSRHRRILDRALEKVNGKGRFHWYLPKTMQFLPGVEDRPSELTLDILDAAADFAKSLGRLEPGFHLDAMIVAELYRSRLSELGLANADGRLRSKGFASTVLPVSTALSRLHELRALPTTDVGVLAQFQRMVRNPRSHAHPLRHCVLIIALFGGWQSFLAAYRERTGPLSVDSTIVDTQPSEARVAALDSRREAILTSLKGGATVTAAAHETGIAVATAMAWAAAGGFSVSRRPKCLSPERRALAIRKLAAGKPKDAVARSVDVSIQTITLLLRLEPGLAERWHQARFARAQRGARRLWDRAARSMARPTATELRARQPAAFAWLYRNDRAWLNDYASRLEQIPKSNHANVRWDQRDRQMAQAVRVVALSLYERKPDRPIKLADLFGVIPRLKALMSRIDRLPLTRMAIGDVTRRQVVAVGLP